MRKFKVGDKVRCINDSCSMYLKNGNEYTITSYEEDIQFFQIDNGGLYPVSRFELVAESPPLPANSHSDTTRIIAGETHSWRGIELTSGAGQVELTAVQGDKSLSVTLTAEQAEKLGSDLLDRVRRMRGMKA